MPPTRKPPRLLSTLAVFSFCRLLCIYFLCMSPPRSRGRLHCWREHKKEEAALSKPPLKIISRKTTTIARVGPAWNGSTSWWRSNSDLTKGNNIQSCIYSIHEETRLSPRKPAHRGHSEEFPFLKFSRFSIFYGFPSFATSRCWCWCCFYLTGDAIWYLKLLSLLVMFVKFFICWQRSRWYLRQSAIWISVLFVPSAGSLTSHLSTRMEAGKLRRVCGGEINVTNTLVDALTATFDNLTISCRCSSVKVLWLLLLLSFSAKEVAKTRCWLSDMTFEIFSSLDALNLLSPHTSSAKIQRFTNPSWLFLSAFYHNSLDKRLWTCTSLMSMFLQAV